MIKFLLSLTAFARREGLAFLVLASPLALEGGGATTMRRVSPETPYLRCLGSGDAAKGVMPATFDCQHEELARLTGEMEDLLHQILTGLPIARQKALSVEQQRWIVRRDPHCLRSAEAELGSGGQDATLVSNSCGILETERRIAFLRNRYRLPQSTIP